MKKLLLLIPVFLLLAGCSNGAATVPTATPTLLPQPTLVAEATPTEAEPTAVPTETPTAEPIEELTATPTATATATAVPTDTATPLPTATATAVPPEEAITPGQVDTATLGEGEFRTHPFAGRQFEPMLFFVEAASGLDVSLAVYGPDEAGVIAVETADPLTQANFSAAGRPEILVFSPDATTDYLLLVQAEAGAGDYTLHTFDTQEGQRATLAAGGSNGYTAVSNEARPVLIFANPVGNANLTITVTGQDGSLIAEGNFGGPGSAESLFLLPLRTTTYTIAITEAAGAAAEYDILIITLE